MICTGLHRSCVLIVTKLHPFFPENEAKTATKAHSRLEQSLTACKRKSIVGMPRDWEGTRFLCRGAPQVHDEPAE
jgi:hypothetical protein